jgi:predicted ATP-grasp superfamily ATP-dependent carboligase
MKAYSRNIFIFEYFSAGGMAGTDVARTAAPIGQSILQAVVREFSRLQGCRTMTCLAPGMRAPHAHEVLDTSPDASSGASDNWEAAFDTLAERADATMVIAPERKGCLAELSRRALEAGSLLLGSSPEGILAASDKAACAALLAGAGVPVPETITATPGTLEAAAGAMGFPLVVKPVTGQACEGVSLVTERAGLGRAVELLGGRGRMLLQRYHPGVHASASLLVSASDVTPLCLNEQRVIPGAPFVYAGGSTPLEHPQAKRALHTAAHAVRQLSGLAGFVGVDMVLQDEGCVVIEVNPRVTNAFTGVSRSLDLNLAEAILRAVADDEPPVGVGPGRRVIFGKEGEHHG